MPMHPLIGRRIAAPSKSPVPHSLRFHSVSVKEGFPAVPECASKGPGRSR